MKKFHKSFISLFLALSLLSGLAVPVSAAGPVKFTGIDTLLDSVGNPEEAGNGFYFVDRDVMLEELTGLGTGRLPDTVFPGAEDQEIPEFPMEELQPAEEPGIPENPAEPVEPPGESPERSMTPTQSETVPVEMENDPSLLAAAANYTVGSVKKFFAQPGTSYKAEYGYFTFLPLACTPAAAAEFGASTILTAPSPGTRDGPLTARSIKLTPTLSAQPGTSRTVTS